MDKNEARNAIFRLFDSAYGPQGELVHETWDVVASKLDTILDQLTPRWISVEEALPEPTKLCLGYRNIMQTVSIVFLASNGKWMFLYEPEFADGITHWQLLTPPAKEEP